MKRLVLLLALMLAVPGLAARNRQAAPVLGIPRTPQISYEWDSLCTSITLSVPGYLDMRQLQHGFEVWILSAADTTVSRLVSSLNIEGTGRERYNRRQLRRQGKTPPKVAWSKKVKIRRHEVQHMSLTITTPLDQEWLHDGLLIRIRQYHSDRPKKPEEQVEERVFRPRINRQRHGIR